MASIEIDSFNVGKIIGPRGATIKQIQDQYRVRIAISKDDNNVRQFMEI
jgi:polyribonucleotide nucleotidyltransferase